MRRGNRQAALQATRRALELPIDRPEVRRELERKLRVLRNTASSQAETPGTRTASSRELDS